MDSYDPRAIVAKWLKVWEERRTFEPSGDGRPRSYVVSMFAYPSGDLHMGHAEAYSIGDAIARFHRMRGHDVLHPVGWDSFGLPAENAARKRGLDPREWTYANIDVQAESFRRLGVSFDWRTRLHSSDPEFYRWNQWLFLRLFERGLAYRASAPVNWCPADETVLANEQVIGGCCERCGTAVIQRNLTQWFFRTTAYAQRLLDDMAELDGNWPADVLTMQRNWIAKLHDWLISRQRYWGTPIPIVHCGACGEVPVPDDELPVRLSAERVTACPRCGGVAGRETDTMDTFVDSSWYFLRYPNPGYTDGPFDPEGVRRWLPVREYIGGKEHATGHLLYARFMTKVLYDLGLVPFVEPFQRLTTQGQVIMNGRAMSKTLGNLVSLHDQVSRYGPDAVRVTMLFAGPPGDDIDWAGVSPTGAVKWLARVWRLAGDVGPASDAEGDPSVRRSVHRVIHETTALMAAKRFNVAIARLMELTSLLRRAIGDPAAREGTEALVRMLSCVAPFTAEEAWQRLGRGASVCDFGWPAADPALVTTDEVTCVVQVDGKVRDRIGVPADVTPEALRRLALGSTRLRQALCGAEVARIIVRPPALVNVVTAGQPRG
jgi:leucyl-tRNA synthetase